MAMSSPTYLRYDEESALETDLEWKEAPYLRPSATNGPVSLPLTWSDLRDKMEHFYIEVRHYLTPTRKPAYQHLSTNSETTHEISASPSRTRSCDGLRGLACLIVFTSHFLYPFTRTITSGHALGDPNERYIHQLPIICLLLRGRAMVTLFFVLSGYVLSSGFLASSRNNQQTKAISRLSSLALRRWMRLFLPPTISMFMVAVAARLGAFVQGGLNQKLDPDFIVWEQHPLRGDCFRDQLLHFYYMWCDWINPWESRLYYSTYDPHTWTIPVEFRGSMVLFVVLLATSQVKTRFRTIILAIASMYSFRTQRWDYGTFLGGAVVADLHQVCSANSRSTMPWSRRTAAMLDWLVLIVGLWIMSYPDDLGDSTPGFVYLSKYSKNHWNWAAFGSFFVLWSVERISLLRNFLSSTIPQYAGQISFSLYLVHGPLLHSIGFAMQPWMWEVMTWGTGLFVGWVIMLILSVWSAHLFNKHVDVRLVKLARYLEQRLVD